MRGDHAKTSYALLTHIFFDCSSTDMTGTVRAAEPGAPPNRYERGDGMPTSLLMDPGYMITDRDANRGHFQASQEPDGARIGAATVREQRMYSASFDTELLQRRSTLYLTLLAEERSPTDANWTARPVIRNEDPEYNRILQRLDRAVQDRGGQGTPVKSRAGR
jgi:hypothetical protein